MVSLQQWPVPAATWHNIAFHVSSAAHDGDAVGSEVTGALVGFVAVGVELVGSEVVGDVVGERVGDVVGEPVGEQVTPQHDRAHVEMKFTSMQHSSLSATA